MFDMLSIFVMWPTERDCHICPPLASSEKKYSGYELPGMAFPPQ